MVIRIRKKRLKHTLSAWVYWTVGGKKGCRHGYWPLPSPYCFQRNTPYFPTLRLWLKNKNKKYNKSSNVYMSNSNGWYKNKQKKRNKKRKKKLKFILRVWIYLYIYHLNIWVCKCASICTRTQTRYTEHFYGEKI